MSIRTVAGYLAISGLFISVHAANSTAGVEARVVVTVADHMNHKPPVLKKDNISDTAFMRIVGITPLYGEKELYVLIDDAANDDFGTKLQELRSFVNSQGPSMAIGLAFIRDGELRIVQTPAKNHQLVASALRAPSGSKPANPYCALSSLINGWGGNVERRAVVMITSGIDYSAAEGVVCARAETATAIVGGEVAAFNTGVLEQAANANCERRIDHLIDVEDHIFLHILLETRKLKFHSIHTRHDFDKIVISAVIGRCVADHRSRLICQSNFRPSKHGTRWIGNPANDSSASTLPERGDHQNREKTKQGQTEGQRTALSRQIHGLPPGSGSFG